MLVKKPKRTTIWGRFKYIVAAEVILFGGSYFVWQRMNASQDFRLYMYKKFPKALTWYYSIETLIQGEDCRVEQLDKAHWRKTGKDLN